jgi:hypothetical protein
LEVCLADATQQIQELKVPNSLSHLVEFECPEHRPQTLQCNG